MDHGPSLKWEGVRDPCVDIVKEGSTRRLQRFEGRPLYMKTSSGDEEIALRGWRDPFRPASMGRRPFSRAWVLLRTIKRIRASDGCLGAGRLRRTWHAAISSGEVRAPFDPEISEWGNPLPRPCDLSLTPSGVSDAIARSSWRYVGLNS